MTVQTAPQAPHVPLTTPSTAPALTQLRQQLGRTDEYVAALETYKAWVLAKHIEIEEEVDNTLDVHRQTASTLRDAIARLEASLAEDTL